MRDQSLKLKKAQIRPILEVTFPGYKGRTFSLTFRERFTFHDLNWGGGTRNHYAFVRSDGESVHLRVPAPWAHDLEGRTVDVPTDLLIVEHCTFCGKDLGVRVYAHPAHAPKWLH
jgi:hypothetical protein